MMPTERTDQPSRITLREIPRAPDEHVTTSDLPPQDEPPAKPEAQAAAAADDASADPPAPATGDEGEPANKPRRRRDRASERRIARLSAQLAEAKARDAEREIRLAELEAKVAKAMPPPAAPKEPRLSDYTNPQDYAKAWAAWDRERTKPPAPPREPAPPPVKQPARAAAPERPAPLDTEIAAFQARVKEEFGDAGIEALNDSTAPIDQTMGEFMFDSEAGPMIYLHLVNNPEKARRIFSASLPRKERALKELERKAKAGELEEKDELVSAPLYSEGDDDQDESDEQEPPPATARRTTRAPAPPSDTRPGSSPAPTRPRLERLSMDEYAEVRRKQMLARMGRT